MGIFGGNADKIYETEFNYMQLLFNPGLRVVFWVISNKDAHDTNDTSVCLRDNGDQTVGTPDLGWFGGGGHHARKTSGKKPHVKI